MNFNRTRSVRDNKQNIANSSLKQWKYALVSVLLTFALIVLYQHVQQY
ncbi:MULTISPECIES: hypothetical protein [Paenibacillus]|uniref:Uncharacterized protein n=1 Tax=Paenibacillus naphthalenovorans TaxID=162209 RepID=A0A0U2UPG7_9BACL|nr:MULTISPECIES: hypothetical protein [Paenibacillus]ALS23889.1 hypothetical protein IJ22_35510 [Paenibacillus naphthalenovorans]GCL72120.1 hypothetical protein PN4B1_20250 [Paenibacillus naphthalenovorans]SDI98748.1 hypothetical protein SAMN05421868_11476 [Paenibacillus naphthalenovorans]